nr:MAG TPA: hypothetical protein [Bacteriophage sp.]
MADYNSAYTGQEIDAGIAKANAAVPGSRTVNGKALSADVTLSAADVGADAAGAASGVQTSLTSHTNNKSNPHGVTAAQVGALPTSGGTMTGSIKMGEHDITGTATNYGLFFDSMGQVIVKAGDSNSVEVTDMGVTIRSDVGITLNGSVSGISKSSVGLGNVDNTSDLSKPISNPTKQYVDGLVGDINSALDAINGEVI